MDLDGYIDLLYLALGSKNGIAVAVDDFRKTAQTFYLARRKANDPDLARLKFNRSPLKPEGELWITKGSPNAESDGDSSV